MIAQEQDIPLEIFLSSALLLSQCFQISCMTFHVYVNVFLKIYIQTVALDIVLSLDTEYG